jgi:3-methylcrotonyl-CoA carboxylase alpha subunit
VLVSLGQAVARSAVLLVLVLVLVLVLEAMKVQMWIATPAEGAVTAICCAPGEPVEDGAELMSME